MTSSLSEGHRRQKHSTINKDESSVITERSQSSDHSKRKFFGNVNSGFQVVIRVRPLVPAEIDAQSCIEILPSSEDAPISCIEDIANRDASDDTKERTETLHIGGESGATFTFDRVFDQSTNQLQVYSSCVAPLVKACLNGYNSTVFCYGQTGSGKTFTMLGSHDKKSSASLISSEAGVIKRALNELFSGLEVKKAGATQARETNGTHDDSSENSMTPFLYEVHVRILEIYGESIRDLLSPGSTIKQDLGLSIRDVENAEPEIMGATDIKITCAEKAIKLLEKAVTRRIIGCTAMNSESSRSHLIMTVRVTQTSTSSFSLPASSYECNKQNEKTVVETKESKFHFVDLAGSERQKRALTDGKSLRESININKGLFVLGKVISVLGNTKKQGDVLIPYRESKLTHVLKGSLGGNHKTLMIACVSPSILNMEESLNCLRYANSAKNIKNKASVNVDPGSRMVSELRSHIKAMEAEMLIVRSEVKTMATELLRVRDIVGNYPTNDCSTYAKDKSRTTSTNDFDPSFDAPREKMPSVISIDCSSGGAGRGSPSFSDSFSIGGKSVGGANFEFSNANQSSAAASQLQNQIFVMAKTLENLRKTKELYVSSQIVGCDEIRIHDTNWFGNANNVVRKSTYYDETDWPLSSHSPESNTLSPGEMKQQIEYFESEVDSLKLALDEEMLSYLKSSSPTNAMMEDNLVSLSHLSLGSENQMKHKTGPKMEETATAFLDVW
eukprot:CAMPEP_0195529092 /NCGR_PEP_ID=MMETSP0794_2-20130614/31510_1 /TAXON_ID=515487 /ORGANISM="Stephanopyxis turris, Strain CCMP 815" /LENGTH=728 /DNA_ID=CAMNT_0040660341 /DNA_START=26 /DNA_END=2210 /DNA_ORIENTATION=+